MKVDSDLDTTFEEYFTSAQERLVGSETESAQDSAPLRAEARSVVVDYDRMSSDPTDYFESAETSDWSEATRRRRGQTRGLPVAPRQEREQFQVRQKWEGHVLEVMEDSFVARLFGIRSQHGQLGQQITEFDLEEIDEADRELIKSGAIFYWTIGYLHPGTELVSRIRFLRQPPLSQEERRLIAQEVARLRVLIDG